MYEHEAARLRALARAGVEVRFDRHALQRVEERGVGRLEVVNMLTRCRVTAVEPSRGRERWTAEGLDQNARQLRAVVTLREDWIVHIYVITVLPRGDGPTNIRRMGK